MNTLLPEKLKTLGDYAFMDCTILESVTFSEGITSIGEGAFSGCTALKEVELPTTVDSIGFGAFDNAEMKIYLCTYAMEGEELIPKNFTEGWSGGAAVEWKYLEEPIDEDAEADKDSSNGKKK